MKKVSVLLFIFLTLPFFIFASNTIDLNTASLVELEALVGIGNSTAQKIIDARPFSSLDDLLKVKGIGPKKLEAIKNQGLASVTPQNSPIIIKPENLKTTKDYSRLVSITELMPAPTGSDSDNEFIALHNIHNSPANLSGWKLEDVQGGKTTYALDNTSFNSQGDAILKRSLTHITLNNEGDSINLISPDGVTQDTVSYEKAKVGFLYKKVNNQWIWVSQNPTTKSPVINQALPKSVKPDTNRAVASLVDSLESSQEIPTHQPGNNPWVLFFIALGIALISGIVVIVLKIKLSKKHERSFPF